MRPAFERSPAPPDGPHKRISPHAPAAPVAPAAAAAAPAAAGFGTGGAGFAAVLDRQIEVWGRVIRDNNIRPD